MALLTPSFLMVIAIAILIPQSQSTCKFTSKVAYCAHGLFTSDKDLNGSRVGIEYLRLDENALHLTNNTFDGFSYAACISTLAVFPMYRHVLSTISRFFRC